jgi:hypothetical protein
MRKNDIQKEGEKTDAIYWRHVKIGYQTLKKERRERERGNNVNWEEKAEDNKFHKSRF